MDAQRLLIVDDDAGIREVLSDYLSEHGFRPTGVASAREMDRELAGGDVELVILDIMMPGEDGLSVCRRLSRSGPPILVLSAMAEETDRIVGLELGADDYMAKPCNPRELLARVRALLRRPRVAPDEAASLVFDGWRLDLLRRALHRPDGGDCALSPGEFALLRTLVERPGRILTREQLLEAARGPYSDAFDRAVDVQISRLRRKLDDGSGRELIATVRGEGYRFDGKVERRRG